MWHGYWLEYTSLNSAKITLAKLYACEMWNKSYSLVMQKIFRANIRRDDISSSQRKAFGLSSRERSHLESEFLFTIGPRTFPNVALKLRREWPRV